MPARARTGLAWRGRRHVVVFVGGRRMLGALSVLLVCQLCGEVLVRALGLPVPGPVLGLVLLLAGLALKREVPAMLDEVAQTLLRHLSLLFVPAGVGVMLHLARLRTEWLPILVALVVSALLTLVVTAFVFRLVSLIAGEPPEEQP